MRVIIKSQFGLIPYDMPYHSHFIATAVSRETLA